jgi:hypothetical protein
VPEGDGEDGVEYAEPYVRAEKRKRGNHYGFLLFVAT